MHNIELQYAVHRVIDILIFGESLSDDEAVSRLLVRDSKGIPRLKTRLVCNIEELKQQKKKESAIRDFVLQGIDQYRALWKNTTRGGAMGNKQECINRMCQFFLTNPDRSWQDIYDAAQRHLDNSGQYFKNADNFIMHKGTSRLADNLLSTTVTYYDGELI